MTHCKHCRFWDQHDTACNRIDWVEENDNVVGDDFKIFATAADDQGLVARLKCGPLFGCVRGLPK